MAKDIIVHISDIGWEAVGVPDQHHPHVIDWYQIEDHIQEAEQCRVVTKEEVYQGKTWYGVYLEFQDRWGLWDVLEWMFAEKKNQKALAEGLQRIIRRYFETEDVLTK